jgi:cell division protein FtsN
MVLRGLWLPALAYLAAMATAVLALAAGLALAEPPAPDSVQWGLWAALLTLALLVPGFFGNAWLYRVYRQRLDNALARTANLKDACTLLARQSRSRPRLTAIALANAALIVSVAIMLWPLHLQQRVWPRVSGEVAIVAGPAAHARPPTAAPTADTAAPTVAAPDPSASAADLQQPADVVQAPPSAAQEPVLETPSTAAVPPAAPAIAEPEPLGPLAQAAARQQATIAAHARQAHLPAAATAAPEQPAAAAPATAASAATVTVTVTAPAPGGRYLINVGLFAEPDNAVRAHTRLTGAGLPAISESLQTRNGQRTRVRVGPFATRAQADAAAARIRALQLDAVVVRP